MSDSPSGCLILAVCSLLVKDFFESGSCFVAIWVAFTRTIAAISVKETRTWLKGSNIPTGSCFHQKDPLLTLHWPSVLFSLKRSSKSWNGRYPQQPGQKHHPSQLTARFTLWHFKGPSVSDFRTLINPNYTNNKNFNQNHQSQNPLQRLNIFREKIACCYSRVWRPRRKQMKLSWNWFSLGLVQYKVGYHTSFGVKCTKSSTWTYILKPPWTLSNRTHFYACLLLFS